MNIKNEAVSAAKWAFLGGVIQRILFVGGTVILARILAPSDYGLFAFGVAITEGLGIMKSLGVDIALVRRKQDFPIAADTAFFIIPLTGVVLFAILFFSAPFAGIMLKNDQIPVILRFLGIIYLVTCFGKVPQTILYKEMKIKYKSIAEISGQTVFIVTAVVLALSGKGVWSLVFAYVTRNIVQIGMEWYWARWTPKFRFDLKIAKEMLNFGKFIFANSLVLYLFTSFDSIIIGKMLGLAALGYYAIAKNGANMIKDYFITKISQVIFPTYAKVDHDDRIMTKILLKTSKFLCFVMLPYAGLLLVFPSDILRIIFGEKWLPAAQVIRFLAISSILNAFITQVLSPVFMVKGNSKNDFQNGLINLSVFLLLIIPLSLKFHLVGVGITLVISALSSLVFSLVKMRHLMKISLRAVSRSLNPIFLSFGAMIVLSLVFRRFIITEINMFSFIAEITFAICCYLFFIFVLDRKLLVEIRELALSKNSG